jgi:hypothetical protein
VVVWRCLQINFLPIISLLKLFFPQSRLYFRIYTVHFLRPIGNSLQIFQNNLVMWNVTDAKFFAYFINKVNLVYKTTVGIITYISALIGEMPFKFSRFWSICNYTIFLPTTRQHNLSCQHTLFTVTQHSTTQYAHTCMDINIQTECSAVGIATRCCLDRPANKSRRGRGFPHPSRPPLGPTQPPLK